MNSEPERLYRITKRTAALFITGAAIVLALNLILVWRNRHLANEAAELQRALEPSPGTLVPPLSGVDADGMAFSLPHGKDAKNTLLLVFSPGCRVCDENWPLWQDIDRSVNRDRFQVVFVDLSGQVTRDYILAHQIGEFPVISKLDPKELIEYNLRLTPETVVIGNDGKIQRVWAGLLGKEQVREIRGVLASYGATAGGRSAR